MKRATDDFLGERISVIYVSLVFSVLHITHLSAVDVLFVLGLHCFSHRLCTRQNPFTVSLSLMADQHKSIHYWTLFAGMNQKGANVLENN